MSLKHGLLLAAMVAGLSLILPNTPSPASQPHVHSTHSHAADESSPLSDAFEARLRDEGVDITGHEADEGPMLQANFAAHTQSDLAHACPAAAPSKLYDVVAIEITMVLNRWGDRDPDAYMFALRGELDKIRAQGALADQPERGYGLSLGLGDDPIQPLTIRANVGDCVRVTFTNELDQPASFHVHGADLVLASTGAPALSSNPASVALPFESVVYEWYIDPDYYDENTHYLHSHGPKGRLQVSHGLFGALIVEPHGSVYFDQQGLPLCGDPEEQVRFEAQPTAPGRAEACRNAWNAMISPGTGSDFREFAMIYHEIGNGRYLTVDASGVPNPSIGPIAKSYRPNGRAINYRSESFWRRLGEMEALFDYADESQAYGSYTFGEPATPIPQSYLGDPVKFRLVHGGSETFHVPHLHGGGIQWQRQQDMGQQESAYTPIDAGLKKHFAPRMPSSGNDSQTIGPSETYELEIACGSGGCQQTVGDFLFHCHVASHYISGMWHFWRVYNTLQDGDNKTDGLATLAALPDRRNRVRAAVNSSDLLGERVRFAGQELTVSQANLASIVETQLPPQGVPNDALDASVWDWDRSGTRYLGEPASTETWPNFASSTPGQRPDLMFDPTTGKLAFPFLHPHLGRRPPFAPRHGPAPYLEPLSNERGEPALPGSNGRDSLCPRGAPQRLYKLHAIQTEIPVTSDIDDPDGMIFVLKEHEAQARSDPAYKVPLAIRANQGDCVDIVFVNELEETGESGELSKTNIHIHFVQFDTQASDGVISGASYEQSPRPFTDPGMSFTIQFNGQAGDNQLTLDDASSFHAGVTVAVGVDQLTSGFETAVIRRIEGDTLTFEAPLRHDHPAGQRVSVEFVRYRWYVARQNGAIYFHDHVDALVRWGHGLFGALIAEPIGASYHHPQTGAEIRSGPIADIHVNAGQEVVPGLSGSFREFVLFMNDDNPYTGSSFNLRAEPLYADSARGQGPPELALSSVVHGDPSTPLLRAYTGDPIMLRLLTSATDEVHPFHLTGHTFRQERFQQNSPPLTVFGVGISERFNAYVEAAGGAGQKAGDYLYYNGSERHFREGSWGILRVHDTQQPDLQPLPGRDPSRGAGFPYLRVTGQAPARAPSPGNPCPPGVRERTYRLSAIARQLVFNSDAAVYIPSGRMYALDSDVDDFMAGRKRPEPLVIRANAGECITLELTNRMDQPASLHLDALAVDPQASLGVTLGFNPSQSVQPGEKISYRYYAEEELGAVLMRDFGNPFRNAREGLYGALIVEPAGSSYVDPHTGGRLDSGVAALIQHPDLPDFREFVTVFQDNDPDIGLFLMPYDEEVNRVVGVNYRCEPLQLRLAQFDVIRDEDLLAPSSFSVASALFNSDVYGEPETNVFESYIGDPVRFRVVSGFSEQPQVFHVEGHEWALTPQLNGSDVVSARYLPPSGVLNVELISTGGPQARTGDYQWGNHRLPFEKAGQWGMMRLFRSGTHPELLPISDRTFVASQALTLPALSQLGPSDTVLELDVGMVLQLERNEG